MKQSIFYDRDAQIGVSCDGKKIEVFGDNVLLRTQFEKIMNNKFSTYNIVKNKKGNLFDPAKYFARSSTFWGQPSVVEYNEHNLRIAKKQVETQPPKKGNQRGKNGNGK